MNERDVKLQRINLKNKYLEKNFHLLLLLLIKYVIRWFKCDFNNEYAKDYK